MDDDDLIPASFQNPYDRLENLEEFASDQTDTIQKIAYQLQEHGNNFVEISKALVQMAQAFDILKKQNLSLQQQAQSLHHRVKVLENKEQ